MAFAKRIVFFAAIFSVALNAQTFAQGNAATAPAATAAPAAVPAPAPPDAPAATTPASTVASPAAAATAGADTPKPEIIPVPPEAQVSADGKFDPDAATKAYLATIKGEARKKSDEYFEGGYVLQAVDFGYALIVAGMLLFGRFSARMRNFATRITRSRFLQVPIYAIQYFIVTAILTFPLTVYEEFTREHKYDLSNQDFMGWFSDWIKLFGVSTLILIVVITIIYAFMRWTKDNWWKWGTLIAIIFAAFTSMIAPVYVAPLINDYKPLAEGQIKEQILSMARANGVPATNVWEFNASKQSKRVSANVSGLLGTTRVSLNDNLINRSTSAEIRAVMGHELGHYVLGHTYTGLSWFLIVFFVAFGFANWGFKKLTKMFGKSWDVQSIEDPAGMPVIFALISFIFFVGTPVLNTMSRSIEGQADIFGLNAAREPDGFAQATLKLSEYRKLEPTALEEIVFYDHPSGRTRISQAMHWKAEHLHDADMVEKLQHPGE